MLLTGFLKSLAVWGLHKKKLSDYLIVASSIIDSNFSGEAILKRFRSYFPPRILGLGILRDTKHYEVNFSCLAGYNPIIIDERK